MRILALPAALLIACVLYPLLPRLADRIVPALDTLYAYALRLFTRRTGQTDEGPALLTFLLLLAGVVALLSAVHPVLLALLAAPLFMGLSVLPRCASVKAELDSGKYVKDIPAYEALVRETCRSLAPAFVSSVCLPLVLCAVGVVLHIGSAPGWLLAALRRHTETSKTAAVLVSKADHIADAVFCALLTLCAGAAGRNPLRTQGSSAQARLMNILGVAGDKTDTHAPMAGDISQGAFLCLFATAFLLLSLTLVGCVLC